uniref:Secreted protein n=1 Tax=Steinernema glaseri TaxID=37863 RepID=A0A1I8AEW9_9BILA
MAGLIGIVPATRLSSGGDHAFQVSQQIIRLSQYLLLFQNFRTPRCWSPLTASSSNIECSPRENWEAPTRSQSSRSTKMKREIQRRLRPRRTSGNQKISCK